MLLPPYLHKYSEDIIQNSRDVLVIYSDILETPYACMYGINVVLDHRYHAQMSSALPMITYEPCPGLLITIACSSFSSLISAKCLK